MEDLTFKNDNSLRPNPAKIQEMFGSVTSRYDFLNHFFSLGRDIFWRRALARRLLILDKPGHFLDLATGTGDQLLAAHKCWPHAHLTGLDFSQPMLDLASPKLRGVPVNLVFGDVLKPPFEDNLFDSISISFGLRNLADRKELCQQAFRLLKPGGRFLILEMFFEPRAFMAPITSFILKKATPWLANRLFHAPQDAYKYLGLSILRFPHPSIILDEMEKVGFKELGYRTYTFDIAMLVWGHKP
ncbi:MAG: ubiquinone/menaquinone biosynthesis methyltransferase [Deltaproteobacteria bacterium]|nr:ubiquinone/menaquinone biosynthesis methyltransferase [Deltaproteobacteria bacterium]